MSSKLNSRQQRLLIEFSKRDCISVTEIYRNITCSLKATPWCHQWITEAEAGDGFAHRKIQQYVGAFISNLNSKLKLHTDKTYIVPGDTKRTYKLVKKV